MNYCYIFICLFLIGCGSNINQTSTSSHPKLPISKPTEEVTLTTDSRKNHSVNSTVKIALALPSNVIGKYAKQGINTVLAYMLYTNETFEIEIFDSKLEDFSSISNTIQQIKANEITNVIMFYTKDGLGHFSKIPDVNSLNIYIPLVHQDDVSKELQRSNIIYGGLNYKAQIDRLLGLSNSKNTLFYSNSGLGLKLKEYLDDEPIIFTQAIQTNDPIIKDKVNRKVLNNSSLFLNTPIVNSSIILSQLRANEILPYTILSTQLNYSPLIISLTQPKDRENFIVTNSIGVVNPKLQALLNLLNLDIEYNWVNYSVLIGIDFLINGKNSVLFPSKIQEGQVQYDITLYQNTLYGFKRYHP